ncbi:CARD- and ANK-domain containing inflammasome adapter protein-like [Spea bombifrons]|uniref:CARD- and ANK-domain containing inflammasome adapter protein-like n=1 Tax=Spea bombifrons TaxID=233779 RepID=UPI002349B03B|nr:CARD- and ANK-domain containing inflammasome adapter protein-like [Spea bombifrons]
MSTVSMVQLPTVPSTGLFANPYAIEVLKTKKQELVDGIQNPDNLLSWLVDHGIFSPGKKVAMSYYKTRTEKNSRLLDILVSKGERACRLFFFPCLKQIEPPLYNSMRQYVSTVNEMIGDGRRQLVGYLLERDKEDLKKPPKEKVEKTSKREILPKIERTPRKLPDGEVNDKRKSSLSQIPKGTTRGTPRGTPRGTQGASVFDAVKSGDLSLLEEMLKGSDINAVNSLGETLLHVAAANGHVPVIEFLIARGAKVDARDRKKRTPLHKASENGHSEAVAVLLRAGANIYGLDGDSQTAVHLAARNNHRKVLKVFLDEEARRYKNRRNFLHMAAEKDDSQLVKLLLENGAPVDAVDDKRRTALFNAVSAGHEATVKVLLENGASVDSGIIDAAFSTNNEAIFGLLLEYSKGLSPDTMISALFKAVKMNLSGIINALVDKGAEVNARNDIEYTPLLLAAELGKPEAAQALVEKGAHLDVRTPNQNTALHLAVQGGNVSIAKLLIRKGMNINITGPGDQTPIHVAAFHNKQDIVDVLIDAGANVNAVTKDLVTPLHIASQRGNLDVAQRLLHHRANVNAKDKGSRTPLRLAVDGGNGDLVQLLLNNKSDPNVTDKDKKTPLHVAAAAGQVEMVEAMLRSQARSTAKDMDGCTPVHYAAAAGSADIVRALMKAGKNKNVDDKNVWRKTPLHVAAEHGHSDLIGLFLNNGAAVNSLDNNRDTPLHCACRAGHLSSVQTLVGWAQGEKANLQLTNGLKKTPLQVAESGTTDSHQQIVTFLKKKMHLIK